MTASAPDTSAVRAAFAALVDALAEHSVAGEPAHLERVRAVDRARVMIGEVAEAALDDAILAARAARPEGATWAALGEVLGVTGQAVSKRAGARSLSRQRQQLSPAQRAERNVQRFAAMFGTTHRPATWHPSSTKGVW